MSPQFVDFDADGKLDIVAGIYDGSPHLARGDGKGWRQPEQILDADGQRIVIHQFWNFDTKKWDKTNRCDVESQPPATGLCTSAVAFDWDGDGDLDLLLGDHKSGHVYRRDNNGTAQKPAFARGNLLVHAGGAPIDVPGTVATLRLFDWNRDGLTDLVVGSMGDAYGDQEGGGVYVLLNEGTKTDTRYAAPLVLVPPGKKGANGAPNRPDAGLYPDAGDIDGDGDFDLIVGGYSYWTPVQPVLSAEQTRRADELRQLIGDADKKLDAFNAEVQKAIEAVAEADKEKAYTEASAKQKAARAAVMKERMPMLEELEKLAPRKKREAFVWLYENTGSVAAGNGAK